MTSSHKHRIVRWAAVLMAVWLHGCAGLDLELPEVPFGGEEAAQIPTKMIPVWTDTVLHTQGKKGVRGFGGRISFYVEEEGDPVKVEGSVVVYAWDDSDAAPGEASDALEPVPDRKYVFTPEQLERHYSKSRLGHSYSLWIPWEDVGGPHRRVTLITRFIATTGGEITSQVARVVLPGPVAKPEKLLAGDKKRARQDPETGQRLTAEASRAISQPAAPQQQIIHAAYEATNDPTAAMNTTRTTTTIDVSPGFADRHFHHPAHIDVNHEGVAWGPRTGARQRGSQQQWNLGGDHPASATARHSSAYVGDNALRPAESVVPINESLPAAGHSVPAAGAETAAAPRSDSLLYQSRVQAASAAQRAPGRLRKEPLPARWQSALPAIPRNVSTSRLQTRWQDASEVDPLPTAGRQLGH